MLWLTGYWAVAVTAAFIAHRIYRRGGNHAAPIYAALTGLVWPWALAALLAAALMRALER